MLKKSIKKDWKKTPRPIKGLVFILIILLILSIFISAYNIIPKKGTMVGKASSIAGSFEGECEDDDCEKKVKKRTLLMNFPDAGDKSNWGKTFWIDRSSEEYVLIHFDSEGNYFAVEYDVQEGEDSQEEYEKADEQLEEQLDQSATERQEQQEEDNKDQNNDKEEEKEEEYKYGFGGKDESKDD